MDTGLLATGKNASMRSGETEPLTLYNDTGTQMPTTVCTAHKYVELCKDRATVFTATDARQAVKPQVTLFLISEALILRLLLRTGLPWTEYIRGRSYGPSIRRSLTKYWEDKHLHRGTVSEGYDAMVKRYEAALENQEIELKKATPYVLSEMTLCRSHQIDPVSGWYILYPYGYLVSPVTGMWYDPVKDILIDQYSKKQVDWKTGYLIDPEDGGFIDPKTGDKVTLTEEQLASYVRDKYSRPPGYGGNLGVGGNDNTGGTGDQEPVNTQTPGDNTEPTPTTPTPTESQRPASDSDLWYTGD